MRLKHWIWIFISLLTVAILSAVAWHYSEPREIRLTPEQARAIGEKIWMNEGAGKYDNLVAWNEGEDFPSLGIGHFIWYPEGVEQTFKESFPGLLEHIASTRELPLWLKDMRYPPWNSREEFLRSNNGEFATQLREFLNDTIAEQTEYIVSRLEAALPAILKQTSNPFARMAIRENFYHVAMQPNGVYALIDYVNFKGEGTSPNERYNGRGWGLAQVLGHMNNKSPEVMLEFVNAADLVLTQRVENAPRDESRWLPGWRRRLQTYLAE